MGQEEVEVLPWKRCQVIHSFRPHDPRMNWKLEGSREWENG